ncbi:MAG: RICIN domain-containing protein [Cytophagaceae bacterium]|nr:RICIN domain-containing protein [Cytophagaceae bacterium]
MKQIILIVFVLLCNLFPGLSQNWQLVWSDEFTNGISADWTFETGRGSNGWGNNELQFYRSENASVQNGNLVITARRENFDGASYTSARMKTQGKKFLKYGKIEARMKMPSFQGVWPAFWMLGESINRVGWPACGEIDIMEHVNTGGTVYGTIHWQDGANRYANFGGNTNTNITDYHLYTVEWDAAAIRWYLDGIKYHEVSILNGVNGTSEFHENFFLLLNMAIGGNWPGFAVDNGAFPAQMMVDYVRVYQQSNLPDLTGMTNLAGTYYLQNRHSGLVLDINALSTADGASAIQWNNTGNTNQQFEFIHLGNGAYRIQAKHSGKALDVQQVSTDNGATIQQWSYGGGNNQQFVAIDAGNGYVKLIAKHSRKLMEVAGFSNTAGGRIQQWQDDGQLSGHWKLIPVLPPFSRRLEAENATSVAGIQNEACSEGGLNAAYIDAGDWMAFNAITIPSTGSYRIEYRVASPNGGRLSQDLNAGTSVLGTVSIPATGGWQNWTTVSQTVNLQAGTYNFGIFASTGGWNMNWWNISRVSTTREAQNELYESEISDLMQIKISPNPVMEQLEFISNWNLEGSKVRILNSVGHEFLQAEAHASIDVSALPQGSYWAVISNESMTKTIPFVKY